ncbi:hypothetical protein GLAREA_04715 [Glarea lozoyensis ATCC 20868]|uniref:Uncharacterized protein n=1 Tax=Glarea lozoyensis (strain ATCC 20868 / MF5171) TaxID=1116229 RepID=S3CS80_GLAL2|nr:uncharacterized protein GLAREA_04715 [Glarea lozoyensis ATCC 20868]EPE27924.1 hypothetical protein GLAREA_04715 [Glarea lozoyensis ATCC 20868]
MEFSSRSTSSASPTTSPDPTERNSPIRDPHTSKIPVVSFSDRGGQEYAGDPADVDWPAPEFRKPSSFYRTRATQSELERPQASDVRRQSWKPNRHQHRTGQ